MPRPAVAERARAWASWGSAERIGRVAARSGTGLLFVFGRLYSEEQKR